jgi:hypothetical protein
MHLTKRTIGCLVVWLFGCLVVWLFGCLVVWLFGCLVVWLFGCLADVYLGKPGDESSHKLLKTQRKPNENN